MNSFTVFTKGYFDGKEENLDLIQVLHTIHNNPKSNIRVQRSDGYRLLLEPCHKSKLRRIDGFSSLTETYRLFNDPKLSMSRIYADRRGPGGELETLNGI